MKEKHIRASECCKADFQEVPCRIVYSKGSTSYYQATCNKCKNYCHTRVIQVFDSDGIEIKAGDIVQNSAYDDPSNLCNWHASFIGSDGFLEIRDLGHNNTGMYSIGDYYNKGHYSQHLDKLTDEDLDYYWDTTRKEAEEILNKSIDKSTKKL